MTGSTGTIVATCLSTEGGVPKYPQDRVVVTLGGIEGDYHSTPEANPRAVSVVGKEIYDDLAGSMDIALEPGDFSENILTEGLGDLSDLEPGDRIRFGDDVEIEVTKQNTPCSNLTVHHPDIIRLLVGRRGVIASVISGGAVQPGQSATIIRAGTQ